MGAGGSEGWGGGGRKYGVACAQMPYTLACTKLFSWQCGIMAHEEKQ